MSDGTPGLEGVGASASPLASVLQSWGVDEVAPLLGGQGEAFRPGDLVFKPAPEPRRSAWLADALDSLVPSAAVRIARPARSRRGTWVVVDRAAYGLDRSVPDPDLLGPSSRQLLIRAVLFRSLSEPEPTDAYDPLIERLLDQG